MENITKRNKIILAIVLSLIFLVSLFVRFYDLEMDSFTHDKYGVIWFDEASWLHNARNKVLFGDWSLESDLWSPMYISPVYNFLGFISFSALGVSTFSMRLIPAIFGVISILISSLLIMRKKLLEGIVFLVLLSMNTMLIAYSRVGMSEFLALFFITITIGLIVYDTKHSWILAGFLAPVLFFSKIISLFFIMAIPTSLALYFLMYRSKETLTKFKRFISGALLSSALWAFWLIPNFQNWLIMNFAGNSSRIEIGIHKTLGAILKALEFSSINPIAVAITIFSILITLLLMKRKEKIPFIDFFLIISLILFSFQVFLADYALRRFVLIVPLILLISARFVCRFSDMNLQIKGNPIKISRIAIIILFVSIYLIFSFSQLGTYFARIRPYDVHIVLKNSQDLSKYIPDGSLVYGSEAMAISLENKIKPYFMDKFYLKNEETILPLLKENKINYAVFRLDLSDTENYNYYYIYSLAPAIPDYIRENFEIIGVLDSKSTNTDCQDRMVYIYKRKGFSQSQNNLSI